MNQFYQSKLKSFFHFNLNSSPITKIACTFFFSFFSSLSLSFIFFIFVLIFWFLNKSGCSYTKEALDLSAKLLEINPECYTAWNYRKLAVQHNLSQSDSDSVTSLFDQELKLVRFLFYLLFQVIELN
jgi:energy-coupling factor transporter transmembrane protein EcfT